MPSNSLINSRIFRALCFAVVLLSLAAVSGCGKGKSTVMGKVRYQGKELTFGNVQIESEEGGVLVGTIGSDGSYRVEGVPTGMARVGVSAMDPKFSEKMVELAGKAKAAGPPDPAKPGGRVPGGTGPGGTFDLDPQAYSLIPLKYEDFRTSTLKVQVARGETKYDIELTDAK